MSGPDAYPCYVYRFYDVHERLLYVGITGNLIARFSAHQRYAPWWGDAVLSMTERLQSRYDAERAEARAIMTEAPVYNLAWPARAWMSKELTSGREPVESLLGILEEAEQLRLANRRLKLSLDESERDRRSILQSLLRERRRERRGSDMSEIFDREGAQAAAWAESDDRANLTADDPRVRTVTPEVREQIRAMLVAAAAGDPDSQRLLAGAGIAEPLVPPWGELDHDGPFDDCPIVEYPDR